MICYRDMTFCTAACAERTCPRKMTDEVRDAAEAWWGKPDAPISVQNFSESCDYFTPEGEING